MGPFLMASIIQGLAFAQGETRDPQGELEKALGHFKKKEYAQALEICRRIEREFPQDPNLPDLYLLQGQALTALEEWKEGAESFSRAAESHPLLADHALYLQGEAWKKAKEMGRSIEAFQRLLERFPQRSIAIQARLRLAEIYFEGGDFSRIPQILGEWGQGNQRKNFSGDILWLLGRSWEGLGQWSKAYQTYQELWLRYPLHPQAESAKARMEALVKAKKETRKSIAPELLFRRALHFYNARLYENALKEMEGLKGFPSRRFPSSYKGERWIDDLYFHRAMSLFYLKKYVDAAERFNLLIHHTKSDEMAEKSLYWRIRALYRAGWKSEALNTLSLLQKSYPSSQFLDRAFQIKGFIHEEKGETRQALAVYGEFPERFPQSPLRFLMIWHQGWLYFREKAFPEAIRAWDRLLASSPPSPWAEKALYWKGRALQEIGQSDEARGVFHSLSQNYPASFYSRLVRREESFPERGDPSAHPMEEPPLARTEFSLPSLSGNDRLRLERGKLLIRLGLRPQAVEELEGFEEGARANAEALRLEIARLFYEAEEYARAATLVRRYFPLRPSSWRAAQNDRLLYQLAFPLGHSSQVKQYAQRYQLDPALLFGLILEESRFNPQALSPAGARGLMQIMPMTGKKLARQLRISNYSDELLYDPEVNIQMGTRYLASLLEEFGGREVLALASYNAGPHVVRQWLAQQEGSFREDDFVENIPYAETRNYVVRVMSNATMYRLLYRLQRVSALDPLSNLFPDEASPEG